MMTRLAGVIGLWRTLAARLFISYLAIVAAGGITMIVVVGLVSPDVFAAHMSDTMPGGMPAMVAHTRELDAELARTFQTAMAQVLLVAIVTAVMTAIGASLFVAALVAAPIRRLAVASRRLAAGHYAERMVPYEGVAELTALTTSFNDMAAILESTERRRLELLGDVAHELRTPIAALEGYLEGMLDGVVEPTPATWARLHAETGRLRRLVDDLQELSRAEAGRIPLNPRLTDAAEIARVAVDRLAGQFEEQGLSFILDIPAGLPLVYVDPDRAVQVMTNLLTNALRYTPAPGEVVLTVRTEGGTVRFSVKDSGVGIADENLPRIFERFYRADKSRSRALGGSGIGLTIARALVEAMGGRIRAESAGTGKGATFSVTFPISRPQS